MDTFKNILRFAVLIALIYFAYFNRGEVVIHYFPSLEQQMPLLLVVVFSILIGGIVVYLTMLLDKFRLKSEIKKQAKQIKKLEDENQKLKEVTVEQLPVTIPKEHLPHAESIQG